MTFSTPPENQGQIIEVSYAGCADGIICRTHDRSDMSTVYRLYPWTRRLETWWDSVGPWNAEPPIRSRGRRITDAQVERYDA